MERGPSLEEFKAWLEKRISTKKKGVKLEITLERVFDEQTADSLIAILSDKHLMNKILNELGYKYDLGIAFGLSSTDAFEDEDGCEGCHGCE